MKKTIPLFCVVVILGLLFFAALASSKNLNLRKCVSSCLRDSKNQTKSCDSNFRTDNKQCRTDYKNCLIQAKNSTNKTQIRLNINNCSLNYNHCISLKLSIKNECKNNIPLYCNNKCINPTIPNENNVDSDGKINCNWRPYTDEHGCYSIFGNSYVTMRIGGKNISRCVKGNLVLGFYFDGNKCRDADGFGVTGNFTLFNSKSGECEEKCLLPKDNGNVDFCLKDSDCAWANLGCLNWKAVNVK